MSAEDRESEACMEVSEAAEYAKRSSLRTDSRSLREARVSSGIAASAYLFDLWRGEAPRQSRSEEGSRSQPTEAKVKGIGVELCEVQDGAGVGRNESYLADRFHTQASKSLLPTFRDLMNYGMKYLLSSPDRTRPEHVASLEEAVSEISGSSLDAVKASDLITTDTKEDDPHPDHIDRILYDTFYSGKYLPCNCNEHPGHICPLNKYLCALRLDCRLTLHGDEAEYFFDTVFAERDKEKPSWIIIRFQISKERDCEASEAELTDVGAAAASPPRLDDFCALLKLQLGPSCIPLRFKGNEPNHNVLQLDVLQPDIMLGCGAGVPLQKVLEDSKLPAAGRLILAYLVARSFWQYYQSDWMRTNWNLRTIQFLPEEDAGDSDLAFNPYVPFLDLQMPDLLPTAPKDFEDVYGYIHQHPRILILGLLLFQICSKLPYETKISAQFSPISVNQDCAHFHRSKDKGTWPALGLNNYYVSAYKNIVAECFPAPYTSNFEGTLLDPKLDVPARRALLRKKVVVPLHGLLKGMQLFDQDDNIRPAALECKNQSVDETGEFDPEAQEWLRKVERLWLTSHISAKFKDSYRYNPRGPVVLRPKVAVLDTGYDRESSFLTHAHNMRLRGHWKDFWEDLQDPKDDDGHGTSMLSLICEIAPFADIYVARIAGGGIHMLNERERTSDNLAKAINWAVREQKVDVVSMSLGWDKEVMVNGKPVVSNAISETLGFRDQKVLFFAAASNFGGGKREMFPATHKNVFSIRATTPRGSHPDFNASLSKNDPFVLGTLGCKVPTAGRGHTQIPIGRTGTSVATAVTAGMVALILGYINTSLARMSWESVKTYDKMLSVLEALSEEPEARKRFITPDKFPLSLDGSKEFEALLTTAST